MREGAGVLDMTERDNDTIIRVTERYERRLAEETGKLRVDMTQGFGLMRTEMSDRNADLLKWLLVFFAAQTATQSAVLAALLSSFK